INVVMTAIGVRISAQ
ncbi:hypothetical protein LDE32_19015, partial [Mycobacterium tuberculosis]